MKRWFNKVFQANKATQPKPQQPVRFYYGRRSIPHTGR